ncbi:MAG: hypothetical protein ACETWG_04840, partial [Candidatus Neomarinimicrobiota bacterium]
TFPSETAYANWMYAARYAGDPDYESLLARGVRKYPANPVLLYLSGMLEHGHYANLKGQLRLEKAASLDPGYLDPWFSLVIHYMDQEPEKVDLALRKILEGGGIAEEIMDMSFNMLALLEPDAILITNGDNDTYPGWILTRLLNIRPDVRIVNRSLLNTDWYPAYVIREGIPRFITRVELLILRSEILEDIKSGRRPDPSGSPFSDTLIVRIIKAAQREGRPVYFAATLASSGTIDRYRSAGRLLGLVTLVTPTDKAYSQQLRSLASTWTGQFRTGGLDSWRLRHARAADAGRKLMFNYFASIHKLLDPLRRDAPNLVPDLFHWYRRHLEPIVPADQIDAMSTTWCRAAEYPEIRAWCREQGYLE